MEILYLIKGAKRMKVVLENFRIVIQSDIPQLLEKTDADVWRYSRLIGAKVYIEV